MTTDKKPVTTTEGVLAGCMTIFILFATILGPLELRWAFYWITGAWLPAWVIVAYLAWYLIVATLAIYAAQQAKKTGDKPPSISWAYSVPFWTWVVLWLAHFAPQSHWPLLR